jgi:hypothetical protein
VTSYRVHVKHSACPGWSTTVVVDCSDSAADQTVIAAAWAALYRDGFRQPRTCGIVGYQHQVTRLPAAATDADRRAKAQLRLAVAS